MTRTEFETTYPPRTLAGRSLDDPEVRLYLVRLRTIQIRERLAWLADRGRQHLTERAIQHETCRIGVELTDLERQCNAAGAG